MIGIDTNVLVRFLTQDDPSQSAAATRLLLDAEAKRMKVRVNLHVLLETVRVLRSTYGHSSTTVLEIVERLVESPPLEVEAPALVRKALAQARESGHELPDVLIGILNRDCQTTWTFDSKAAKLPGFTLLKG